MEFADLFRTATKQAPYPFQERFAKGPELPHLLRAPTGSGKTATAVLGWLWRHRHSGKPTPRRLVYCLPMRVLVEQSERAAKAWREALGLNDQIDIHVLMGGVEAEEWFLHPEKPAILIGTQDMLLSRGLNRGYAASRFHWPIDFGLLNNDCLWIFDEPQLMGNGVSTSAQLAGLRQSLGGFGACPSIWMSATLEPSWLDTIDFRGKFTGKPLELDEADYADKRFNKRLSAAKTLAKLDASSAKDMKDVAKSVLKVHEARTQTLVIVNVVDRAKALYGELRKKVDPAKLMLIHSRFRPVERQQLNDELQREHVGERIIVATQVVEAGVDISSRTLITELCPWASMVQRFGRCNRTGDDGSKPDPAKVFWIDLDEKLVLPYEQPDLHFARGHLATLEGKDVSPMALDDFKKAEGFTLPFEHKHVLRRRDLLDLFDTTPDLSGNDIDVSRFVRSDDPDTDVQVFWREWDGVPEEASPERHELCSVSLSKENREFFKELADRRLAYVWDHLEGEWVRLDPRELRPGVVMLLAAESGGYSEALGWDAGSKLRVKPYPPERKVPEEAIDSDQYAAIAAALTIDQHTQHVCDEVSGLLSLVSIPELRDHLRVAARWHDLGKVHAVFQEGVRRLNDTLSPDRLWAKSGRKGRLRYKRKHFRHELASALGCLQQGLPFPAAYLAASHHGRVRLSIRSLPGEAEALPNEPPELFALGVYQGDELKETALGEGITCPLLTLDLAPMRLGGEASWTAKALALLADLGPFKLAYLEALLCAADRRASQKEASRG